MASPPQVTDRRASPRRAFDCEALVRLEDGSHTARLRSLSRLGALVELEQPLAVGTPLTLVLDLAAEDGPLRLRGQAVRVDRPADRVVLAVMFAPLAPQVLAEVDRLLETD